MFVEVYERICNLTALLSYSGPIKEETSEILSNDIRDAVGVKVSTTMKYHLLTNCWVPPKSHDFPSKTVGSGTNSRQRRFQHSWLTDFPWLAYSKKEDGAYCRYCVLFPPSSQSTDLGQLVTQPLSEFSKGRSYLQNHNGRKYHLFAKEKAENFKSCYENRAHSIKESIDAKAERQQARIRGGLLPIVKGVIYLTRQGHALHIEMN